MQMSTSQEHKLPLNLKKEHTVCISVAASEHKSQKPVILKLI